MARIDNENINTYVVCEGEVYAIDAAPKWLCQDNWMCDWMFVGAYSPAEAVAVASVVCDACNKRTGRIAGKGMEIMNKRSRIFNEDRMTPAQIYATQGNKVDSNNLVFRQGWVKI